MKSVIRHIALSMWMLCGFGIIMRGKRAKRNEAPIVVCAPHSTFFDAMVVYIGDVLSPLVRVEEQRFGSKFSFVHVHIFNITHLLIIANRYFFVCAYFYLFLHFAQPFLFLLLVLLFLFIPRHALIKKYLKKSLKIKNLLSFCSNLSLVLQLSFSCIIYIQLM